MNTLSPLYWEKRYEYYSLIEDFLNGPISFLNLENKYKTIWNRLYDFEHNQIIIEVDIRSKDFANYIDDLASLSER